MRFEQGLIAALWLVAPICAVHAQEGSADTAAETQSEPATLRTAAEAIDPLGQAEQSEAAWQSYLQSLERSGGSVEDQAFALNRIGDSRYYRQMPQAGIEASLEARRRLERVGATDGEAMADTLANLATFYGEVGESDKELPLQEQSLAIRKRLYGDDPIGLPPSDAKSLGLGYLNYANALYVRGRFAEAANLVKPSVEGLIEGQLQDATLFVAMASGANMLSDAGRQVEALEMAQRGVAKATELLPDDHPFIGFSQGTLAKVLLQSDRFEEAEAPARRALDIMAAKLGPDNRNTLSALHNLGVILARLGRFEEALELLTARYDNLNAISPGDSVNSLVSASNAAHELGKSELALKYGMEAAEVAGKLSSDHRNALKGLTVLALRQDEAGDYSGARDTIEAVAARRLAAGDTGLDPTLEVQRGLFAIRTGDVATGWSLVETGFAALEEDLLATADQAELGADLASYYEPIMQVVEAASAANRPATALRAFELASWGVNARSRQLLALKTSVRDDLEIAGKIEQFDSIRARLRLANKERASLLAGDKVTEAAERAAEITELKATLASLRTEIADVVPDFGQWLRPDVPTIASLQERLAEDQALLIVMPSRSRTFSMVISADSAVIAESNKGRPVVRPLVAKLRSALDRNSGPDSAFPVEAAAELHDIILPGETASALEGKSRVAVVTSDALSRLPFGLLLSEVPAVDQADYKSMDWLVRKHAFSIALTPSSAFSKFDGKLASANFLGVGAPSLNGNSGGEIDTRSLYRSAQISFDDIRALPALPATVGEISEVADALGSGKRVTLTGDDATEQRVRADGVGDYSVALFATHGLLGGEIGGLREPALVLTPPSGTRSSENDGLLQASEIAALGLRADFVILSACNSAAGRNDTAPAYTGLANAFLGSGSRALMLSHWRVRDDAAAYLSVNTVKRSQVDLSRAEALRKAQLAILDGEAGLIGGAHPSIWAPFVVIEN